MRRSGLTFRVFVSSAFSDLKVERDRGERMKDEVSGQRSPGVRR